MRYVSTKIIPMGSTAFRQWRADSHCKLIHGYRLQCKLWFTADELDDKNWVFDFGGCREIKKLLEKQFDHTTVVAADDPELSMFELMYTKGMIDLRIAKKGVGIERTAEWVYDTVSEYVNDTTDGRVRLIKVEVWEHEGNSAIYEQDELQIIQKENLSEPESEINTNTVVIGNNITEVPEVKAAVITKEKVKEEVKIKDKPQSVPSLYNKRSSGFGDPFAGTSWGNK